MISEKGIEFLTNLEGFKTKAYKDSKQLWTIGIGHLIDLTKERDLLTRELTKSEVQKLFDKDLDRFELAVKNSIKVPLKKYQFDALVSLAFNIGENAFKKSTLVRLINAKAPVSEIIKAFALWKNPQEIRTRRAKEIRLFVTGNYSNLLAQSDFNKYFNNYA
jgi:lysozyme